jgi:glycosyltransferase involved in cell wall biosynthesis
MPAVIDVIIPVYNGAAYLQEAIRSIQDQSVRDIQIIVIDDGSTDDTPALLRQIAAADARVTLFTTPNQGIVEALNLALSKCTAEFVARHDADDVAYPHRFAVQLNHFAKFPKCVAQSSAVRHIDEFGHPTGNFGRLSSPERADARYVPAIEPYLIHPYLMIRRTAAIAVGGYRHVLHSEDTDLYWRLRERGELHNMDQVLGDYRLHNGSISGGSIVNGRIMALSSQMSAISAVRRAAGIPDLTFSLTESAQIKGQSGSLQKLFDLAASKLSADEQAYLRIALGAKMLELTGYRPYEVELEDCAFVRSGALTHMRALNAGNRALLVRRYSGTVARLLHTGRRREARALLWPALLPPTLYRLALRTIFPPAFRVSVKKVIWPPVERLRQAVGAVASRLPRQALR